MDSLKDWSLLDNHARLLRLLARLRAGQPDAMGTGDWRAPAFAGYGGLKGDAGPRSHRVRCHAASALQGGDS